MTSQQLKSLSLGLPANDETCLRIESALQWLLDNTTLKFDIDDIDQINALPAPARLFLVKYNGAMSIRPGISSESIEGLSQSFNTSNSEALIWDAAYELLGKWLKPPAFFVTAVSRWE